MKVYCPNLKTVLFLYLDEVIEGASVSRMFSVPNKGISGFLLDASRAAADGDKRPGGADRTVDIQPPQSESMLILSFDELILQEEMPEFYSPNHFLAILCTNEMFVTLFIENHLTISLKHN